MSDDRPFVPLAGVRVLDLSRYLPGPLLTGVLRDLGADVVKVEPPSGDALRFVPPHGPTGDGVAYATLNAAKRRVVLPTRTPEGQAALRELVVQADVLVESFRPGTLSKMGLSPELLAVLNPRLIVCSLSGFGQSGPSRRRAGHDLNYVARAGVLGLFGPSGAPPQVPGVQLADVAGGALPGAIAVLAALLEREQTGRGRHLDVSLSRGVMALGAVALAAASAGGEEVRGEGFLTGGAPGYQCYRTADDRFLAVGALEPHFFMAFCEVIGRPELSAAGLSTGAAAQDTVVAIQDAIRAEPLAVWVERFGDRDVCVEAVRTPAEAMAAADAGQAVFSIDGVAGVRLDLGAPLPEPARWMADVDADALLTEWR